MAAGREALRKTGAAAVLGSAQGRTGECAPARTSVREPAVRLIGGVAGVTVLIEHLPRRVLQEDRVRARVQRDARLRTEIGLETARLQGACGQRETGLRIGQPQGREV